MFSTNINTYILNRRVTERWIIEVFHAVSYSSRNDKIYLFKKSMLILKTLGWIINLVSYNIIVHFLAEKKSNCQKLNNDHSQ